MRLPQTSEPRCRCWAAEKLNKNHYVSLNLTVTAKDYKSVDFTYSCNANQPYVVYPSDCCCKRDIPQFGLLK